MPSPHRRQRAPSPPTAWGRCAAVKGSLRRPGRLKILPQPQRPTPCQRRHIPTVDRGVPSALDRRSAPARRHPRQPRSSPDWTRLTHVAIAPNIPRIAAGHPNNRRFTDRTFSPSLSHWTAGDPLDQFRLLDGGAQGVAPFELNSRQPLAGCERGAIGLSGSATAHLCSGALLRLRPHVEIISGCW